MLHVLYDCVWAIMAEGRKKSEKREALFLLHVSNNYRSNVECVTVESSKTSAGADMVLEHL